MIQVTVWTGCKDMQSGSFGSLQLLGMQATAEGLLRCCACAAAGSPAMQHSAAVCSISNGMPCRNSRFHDGSNQQQLTICFGLTCVLDMMRAL